jgi:hypothetical protein
MRRHGFHPDLQRKPDFLLGDATNHHRHDFEFPPAQGFAFRLYLARRNCWQQGTGGRRADRFAFAIGEVFVFVPKPRRVPRPLERKVLSVGDD